MKDFSFFEQALRVSQNSRLEDLGRLSNVSRRDFDERQGFTFSTFPPGVEYACLLIENALLLRANRAGRIYAGFEKLSNMQPIVDCYLRIADLSESVFIFGEADWKPPRHPNIRAITLKSNFKLAKEWFLIADSPTVHVAVIARAENNVATAQHDRRIFSVIKTSDEGAVTKLATAAEDLIDLSLAAA